MTDQSANRGRERRRRKEARSAEIIEAGLREFAEKGFAAARLDDVAARAGVAKGTIYLYFPSKEALFKEVVLSRVSPILDGFEASLAAFPGSTEDLVRMLLTRMYQELLGSDLHVIIQMIIAEGGRFPAIAGTYHREIISKGRLVLELIVKRGIDRGEVRPGAGADLPMVIIAPALMAAIWRMTFERFDPIPPERFLAAHLDIVLNGLRA